MNKGVKLLLARRETNPEEFMVTGEKGNRWSTLLLKHQVDLTNPSKRIPNPNIFTNEVMKRILTAYDLTPKPSGIKRNQLLKELLPGLQKLFDIEYSKKQGSL